MTTKDNDDGKDNRDYQDYQDNDNNDDIDNLYLLHYGRNGNNYWKIKFQRKAEEGEYVVLTPTTMRRKFVSRWP